MYFIQNDFSINSFFRIPKRSIWFCFVWKVTVQFKEDQHFFFKNMQMDTWISIGSIFLGLSSDEIILFSAVNGIP